MQSPYFESKESFRTIDDIIQFYSKARPKKPAQAALTADSAILDQAKGTPESNQPQRSRHEPKS